MKLNRIMIILGLLSLALYSPPVATQAGTSHGVVYVAPLADCGAMLPCFATIQAGVDYASAGDTIKVAAGTYSAPGFQVVYLDKPVTLLGGYSKANWTSADPANQPTIVDALSNLGTRAFYIDGGATVEPILIRGFVIQNGLLPVTANGAGIEVVNGNVTINGNVIKNNFVNNERPYAYGWGGGVHVLNGTVVISENTFSDNTAPFGGGIYVAGGNVLVEKNEIKNNTGTSWQGGGGISIHGGSVEIRDNHVFSNSAHWGAGIYLNAPGISVHDNLIESNSNSDYGGGGIFVGLGPVNIQKNVLRNNHSGSFCGGGGIYVLYTATGVKIEDNLIENNTSAGDAGGISIYGGVTLKRNIVRNNSSQARGGGLLVSDTTLWMEGNQWINNSAKTDGSAISCLHSSISGQNDVIAQNMTPMQTINLYNGCALTAKHWTVANNGIYGIVSNGSTAVLTNLIVANHSSAGLYGAGITSTRALFYGNGSNCLAGVTCSDSVYGDPRFIDASNGDFHISPTSAAVDAGLDIGVSTDLDLEARPTGAGFDLGADEISTPPVAGFSVSASAWAGTPVSFSNTSTSSGISQYAWAFGDGTTSTDPSPVHIYTNPGTYTAALTVTNRGGSDSISHGVDIPYAVVFSTSSPDWLPQTTTFTNATVTAGATTYTWDFGDGETSSEVSPTHHYAAAGVYPVTLSATNTSGTGTKTQAVTVFGAPQPAFISTSPDWLGQTTSFSASLLGAPAEDPTVSYTWNFGDGTISAGAQTIQHTYSLAGAYVVTLTTSNAAGSSSIQHSVTISAPAVRFTNLSEQVSEGGAQISIAVQLSQASEASINVNVSSGGGTATAGSDYQAVNHTLTFNPGETSQSFVVQINDDNLAEPGETVHLALSGAINTVMGTPATIDLLIRDNDPPVITSLAPSTIETGASDFLLTVNGSNFVNGVSVIQWNGISLPTTYVDSTRLVAPVEAARVSVAGFQTITVTNPAPGGGISNSWSFAVNSPAVQVCPGAEPRQVELASAAGIVKIDLYGVSNCGSLRVQATRETLAQIPAGFTITPTHFDLSENGTGFSKIKVSLPIDSTEVTGANLPEKSLRLLHNHNNNWQDVTTQLDWQNHTITGEMDSLSPLVVGAYMLSSCSITINNGEPFSGSLNNTIFSNTPQASMMMLSNDAGFIGATWQDYATAIPWTVTDPGSRIVTLIVYARLKDSSGNLLCGGSLSDDIIFDPLAPTASFQFVGIADRRPETLLALNTDSVLRLSINANDQPDGSGVREMQISQNAGFSGSRWVPWTPIFAISALPGETIYVRTRDGVGNVSPTVSKIVPEHLPRSTYLPLLRR